MAGLLIACAIISRSLGAYLAAAAPEAALVLDPHNATALVTLAERFVERGSTELRNGAEAMPDGADWAPRLQDLAQTFARAFRNGDSNQSQATDATPRAAWHIVRALAKRALAADTLNPTAWRLLGQAADADGDPEQADRFMMVAGRLSSHESQAVFWLAVRRITQGRTEEALDLVDRLLRTRPDLVRNLAPLLGRMAEANTSRDALVSLLARHPPWRQTFFANLPGASSDLRTPLMLMIGLRDAETGPTRAELVAYLEFLIRRGHHELAYYTWLQLQPPDRLASLELLQNGNFDEPASGMPFDWTFRAGQGVSVDIVDHPERSGARALAIAFWQGRVVFGGVVQTVLLSPGSYRLAGSHKVQLQGRRGLRWRISCAGSGLRLGEGDMVMTSGAVMTEFSVPFQVPPEGCRAQQIRLVLDARSPSEELVTGRAWYADLGLVRE